jgi:hypothetical protein
MDGWQTLTLTWSRKKCAYRCRTNELSTTYQFHHVHHPCFELSMQKHAIWCLMILMIMMVQIGEQQLHRMERKRPKIWTPPPVKQPRIVTRNTCLSLSLSLIFVS